MNFVEAMNRNGNMRTENGALALSSTGSSMLDFFSKLGAMRLASEDTIVEAFVKAMKEDKLLALKAMFYARNIRGGLKERRIFRVLLKYLANNEPELVKKNIQWVAFFGRFDDLYELVDTPLEGFLWEYFSELLTKDYSAMLAGRQISLLAKWLKSANATKKETIVLGKKTAKGLHLSESRYRKILSMLRKKLDVVEVKMSSNAWDEIEYDKIPSVAMKNLRKAFERHDYDGFNEFLNSVSSGEKKIHADTLFPYDILRAARLRRIGYSENFTIDDDKVLEAQWNALPNYVSGENDVLIMCDTSASMLNNNAIPLSTAIGLSIYFAERNKGIFSECFMTFSSSPSFVTIKGDTLKEKVENIPFIVEDTDLERAFCLILDTAIAYNLSKEQMPKALLIISDMEMNACTVDNGSMIFIDAMRKKYRSQGYEMPSIIFWNVEGRNSPLQARNNDKGVQLCSGNSESVFKDILKNIDKTPYESMIATLNNEMYDVITL